MTVSGKDFEEFEESIRSDIPGELQRWLDIWSELMLLRKAADAAASVVLADLECGGPGYHANMPGFDELTRVLKDVKQ